MPGRDGNPCIVEGILRNFINGLRRDGKRRGIDIATVFNKVDFLPRDQRKFCDQFQDAVYRYKPDMVITVFDNGMDDQYGDFKLSMDHVYGIPSQGLLAQTVTRNPRGCIDNVLFKINVKNGGN